MGNWIVKEFYFSNFEIIIISQFLIAWKMRWCLKQDLLFDDRVSALLPREFLRRNRLSVVRDHAIQFWVLVWGGHYLPPANLLNVEMLATSTQWLPVQECGFLHNLISFVANLLLCRFLRLVPRQRRQMMTFCFLTNIFTIVVRFSFSLSVCVQFVF